MGSRLLLWFAVLLLLLLRLRPMLLSFMEVMDTELVWDMLVLAMVLDLAMLVLATDMDLLPQLLPDTESPMLPTLWELQELPLLLSPPLLEDMLELAGMLPTLLVLSMLLSVRLRLSQRLKLMLVFSMEPMDMVLVLDMLDSDMDIPVLDMLDMVVMDLDMDILVLDMLDMVVMDSDMVLDMDVPSMVKQLIYASKSSKVFFFDSVPSIGIGISCSDLINMISN